MTDTISRMIDRGARIRWHCDVSVNHYGDADLKRIAKAKGGDYRLANKHPPCRIPGCPGIVTFKDCSSQFPVPLDTITDQDDAWWALNERRRTHLKALGYRMELGKWVAPEKEAPA